MYWDESVRKKLCCTLKPDKYELNHFVFIYNWQIYIIMNSFLEKSKAAALGDLLPQFPFS